MIYVLLQVKQVIVGKDHKGDVPLLGKIAAGLATGALAITVASPTDLVKVSWRYSQMLLGSTCRCILVAEPVAWLVACRNSHVLKLSCVRNDYITPRQTAGQSQQCQRVIVAEQREGGGAM